jgi:hypothetical protein
MSLVNHVTWFEAGRSANVFGHESSIGLAGSREAKAGGDL